MTKQKCILILGMHRSGTSATSGLFRILGVNMGIAFVPPAEDNPKGFFENQKITLFNDSKLLPHLKRYYDDLLPLERGWDEDISLEPYYREAEEIVVSDYSGSALFGIKDPRMCILFPFWERVFSKLKLDLYTILPVRNPLEVALSLAQRNGFSNEKSLLLWSRHVLLGEFYSRNTRRVFMAYDDLLNKTEETIRRIQDALGLYCPVTYEDAHEEIEDFLDKKMKHHQIDSHAIDDCLPDFIRKTAIELFELGRAFSDGKKKEALFDALREDISKYTSIFYNRDFVEEKELLTLEVTQKTRLLAESDRLKERFSQLYIDSGDGFCENECMSVPCQKGEKVIEFDLSGIQVINDIRFDPINDCGIIEIQNIELETNRKIEKLDVRSSNAVIREKNIYFFQTRDPQLFLAGNVYPTRSERIKIYIRYHALGNDALDDISQAVSNLITSNNYELASLGAQLSEERESVRRSDSQLASLDAQLSEAREYVRRSCSELSALGTQLYEAREYVKRSDSELAALSAQLSEARESVKNSEIHVNALQYELAIIKRMLDKKDNILKHILTSTSWKFGKPLRYAGRVVTNLTVAIRIGMISLRSRTATSLRSIYRHLRKTFPFDSAFYLETNPDVREAGINPLFHYLEYGYREGRNPNPLFDSAFYLETNPDVREAGINPLFHYLEHGFREGRSPNPLFDSAFYLETNPDVREAGINPLSHYLEYGFREGRNPSPHFDSAFYLETNPDVREAGINPLIHFLTQGRFCRSIFKFPKGDSWKDNLVVVVSHDASNSGAPLIALNIGKTLRSSFGKQVATVLLRGGPLEEEFESIGPVYNIEKYTLSELSNATENLLLSLRASGAQYCICNTVLAGNLVPLLDKYGFGYVNLIHELPASIRLLGATQAAFNIACYSQNIVFPSKFVRDVFASKFPLSISRTTVKPQGVNFKNTFLSDRDAARRCVRERLGIGADSFMVLGCGYADLRKGFDLFGKIAATVLSKTGSETIHFVWLGERARDLEHWIRHDAAILGIQDHLHCLGFQRDPGQIFAAADVFVLASREDPFPTVVLEAMDAAVPVIAFEGAGGAPEILGNGCGIVVPYLDVESMADEIIGLIADHERYDSISKKAQEKIRAESNYDQYVETLLDMMQCRLRRFEPYKVKYDNSLLGKKKVLHIIANACVGGSTQLVADIVENLSTDYYHKIITCKIPSPPAYIGMDIDVFRIDSLSAAKKAIIDFDPLFAHIHYWGQGDYVWYSAMFQIMDELKIPIIQNINVPVEPFEQSSIMKNIYVSHYVKENFSSPTDAQVIYPGSDFEFFSARNLESYPDNCIGMVYRLDRDKITPESIDIFVEVAKRIKNVKCLIVGDGELFPTYAEKVWQSGLTANFAFSGYVSYYDLPQYYREMSIFVAPIFRESFGQVVPFAMSIGMPVVGYDVGALPEIIGAKDLLAPIGNVSRLADIIVDLLGDREKMVRIALHNQQRVRQLFSVQKMIGDYASLYKEACSDFDSLFGKTACRRELQSSAPKRYKILIVLPDLDLGGGQIFAIRIANFLAGNHEVYLYNARPDIGEKRALSFLDSKVELLHSSGLPSELRSHIIDRQIEIVNSHVWWADKLVFQAAADLSVKWSISMHGCYEALIEHPEWDAEFPHSVPSLLARADKILFIAEKNLTIFEHMGQAALRAKCIKVHNGYCRNDDAVPQMRESIGIQNDDFIFGLVSRAIPEKGWKEAIYATMMVNSSLPNGKRAHLILVGDSEYSRSLKAQFHDIAYIHFTGFSAEPAEWIQIFDVGMLPSYFISESQPLVILEYLAYQKPVIATDVGDIRHMLNVDGKSAGIVIPLDNANSPVSPKLLSRTMKSLLTNENGIFDSLRFNTREAFEKFDMKVCGSRYFNEIVA